MIVNRENWRKKRKAERKLKKLSLLKKSTAKKMRIASQMEKIKQQLLDAKIMQKTEF